MFLHISICISFTGDYYFCIIIFVQNAYLIIINVEMVMKIQICIHDFPDDFL